VRKRLIRLKLLKNKQEFIWQESQQKAFEELKKELLSKTCLYQPDFNEPFILTTDASNVGLGAVFRQMKDGKDITIAYASRTLVDAEFNYSITEKEMLGVLWSMEFRYFLLGRKFKIFSDHKALEALTKKGEIKSGRI
jgi:spore maturation protein CgeB